MAAYVVTAGYVTVETERPGGGRAAVDVPRGQLLPADVSQEQIEWELRLGTIEPVKEKATPAAEVPQGMSVANTMAWVGDDLQRAALALAYEREAESPRATLISRLESKLDG